LGLRIIYSNVLKEVVGNFAVLVKKPLIDIFLKLIHRIDKKADKTLKNELIRTIKTVNKKKEILYKIAKASTQKPHDTVENVLFPAVGKDVLQKIVEEYEGKELEYENSQIHEKKKKNTPCFYGPMKTGVISGDNQ